MKEKPKSLEEIEKKDIFKVPDGYFEKLESRIETRMSKRGDGARVVNFYSQHRVKLIGLAAAAAVSLLIIFLPGKPQANVDVSALLAEVSADDCLAYLNTSELALDDIIRSTSPEDIDDAFGDYLVPVPEIGDSALDDLLFEKFGATSDEKLKSL